MLRLVADEGKPTGALDINEMAESFYALGDSIEQGVVNVEHAIVVAVVDGVLTYTPIGHVSLVEGIGMLEMASRKIERDALA